MNNFSYEYRWLRSHGFSRYQSFREAMLLLTLKSIMRKTKVTWLIYAFVSGFQDGYNYCYHDSGFIGKWAKSAARAYDWGTRLRGNR